jgi:hypothetical protein
MLLPFLIFMQNMLDTRLDKDLDLHGETASFDAIRFVPGDVLQLELTLQEDLLRLPVRIVGFLKQKSIVVTAPLRHGHLVPVREQQPFIAKAFSGQNICGFDTTVLKVSSRPYAYLHLEFPDSIRMVRVRKSARAFVELKAEISRQQESAAVVEATIVDISITGARLIATTHVGDKGQKIRLAFSIQVDESHTEAVVIDAWVRFVGEEPCIDGQPQHIVGLEFDDLSRHSRLVVMNLVHQYLLSHSL